ncbi:probable RNA-binding protein 46 isoform X2 [Stegodyphus dumicola]|uniref:probable RNA-binding protein 46 isoform X2 n=1 Tax=Stegodyphus dumicola TaxID=202533 RepID=UPI0015AB4145|nr:probable RNA-binding protein 46 isoform X2 [Stegodyphus dumicola]
MADIFVRDANLVALIEKTGYNIVQENGQRKYGPPPGWVGPPPPKGSEIFIGKLPRDVFEDELVPLCEQFGKIYELRLMMDFNGNNRGYAFVTYTNTEDAGKAIKGLDCFEIRRGRHIGVCKSIDNCRLFIGGIPKDKSKEEIKHEVSKYTEGVSKVILYSSILDKTKYRGFAFVEYESHRAAAMARRKLIAANIKLFDHEIAVDWAQPEAQVDDETMKRVTVLYVRNLSALTSEEQLRVLFSMGGALRVERVKKMRDFAFIHYYKREEAETALKQFDGIMIDDCVLEVTWAKPPETQKQKSLIDKRDVGNFLYKPVNYENFDPNLELSFSNSSSVPGFSFFPRSIGSPRSSARPRFPISMQNLRSTFPITRPVQLLYYICLENGWGEPLFQVSHVDSDPCELFFVCWVIMPGCPFGRRFMSDKISRTPEEAKLYAACHVLKKFGINCDHADSSGLSSYHLPIPSSYANISKNLLNSNSLGASKSASNLDFCSPPKAASYPTFKSQPSMPFFNERGQGDTGNVLPSSPSSDTFQFEDVENSASWLDPNTPIEPNSILGLLASMAAATNVDLPIFNKQKL